MESCLVNERNQKEERKKLKQINRGKERSNKEEEKKVLTKCIMK